MQETSVKNEGLATIGDASIDARHLIEQRESPGKGFGIIARQTIPRGTRIVAEAGLLQYVWEKPSLAHIHAFERLPSSQRRSYLALHSFESDLLKLAVEKEMGQRWEMMSPLHRKVLSIWATNAFGDVFLLGSRFNHSCTPNVNFSYNTLLKLETFHTARDIKTGEELTIMYIIGTNLTREQRQKMLLSKWGFKCNCLACEDTPRGRQKEAKRIELFKLDQEKARHVRSHFHSLNEDTYKIALKVAQRMAAVQKFEGLLCIELSICYHDAARWSARLGDVKMALLWAEKEVDVEHYCRGPDHKGYQNALTTVTQLRLAANSSQTFDYTKIEWFDAYDDPPTDD